MRKKSITPFDATEVLREHGFKATPVRLLLVSLLHDSPRPLSVASLIKKTKKTSADAATIYRALSAYAEAGIISEVRLSKEQTYYEFLRDHRHYIVCDTCGAIESVAFCVRDIDTRVIKSSKLFRQISAHHIDFVGTCRKCIRAVR